MNAITTFDSTKESLLDMLRSIAKAKHSCPDFQQDGYGMMTTYVVYSPVFHSHIPWAR